jgi:LEA14-like dessication related protein
MNSFIQKTIRGFLIVILIVSSVFMSACSVLQSLTGAAQIQPPQVSFTKAELTGLSFDQADLMFNLNIRNPNRLGVKLAGFDYDFLIDGTSFLKGKQDNQIQIPALGENTIQIPLSLNFANIYQTVQNLRDTHRSAYQINCGFAFDVPVLGAVRVPVSKGGDVPMLKRPKINIGALRLKNLGFTRADLGLEIKFNNPNLFSMLLQHLEYRFDVDGKSWVTGDTQKEMQIAENGESTIEIPISLNFLQLGTSVYKAINDGGTFDYQFQGGLDLSTSVPLLDKVNLPFNLDGQIEVSR